MKRIKLSRSKGFVVAFMLVCAGWAMPSLAEEPVATALDVGEANDYLGIWNIKIEVMGNEFELILTLSDVDGKTGATLDSAQQAEPLAIPEISKTDDGGLELSGELKFGESFTLDIIINILKDGDGLGGQIVDKGGLFKADLVGTAMSQEDVDNVQGRRPDPTEARLTVDGKKIRIGFADLSMDTSDWELFQKLGDGEVFTFTLSRATKMYTDLDLAFGDTIVKSGNVADDYPGVYSLWLKKGEDGWRLLFNEQPDIWGTRYDAKHDVAEVPLTVAKIDGEPQGKFLMVIEENDDKSATLKVRWGNQEWSAPFSIQAGAASAD